MTNVFSISQTYLVVLLFLLSSNFLNAVDISKQQHHSAVDINDFLTFTAAKSLSHLQQHFQSNRFHDLNFTHTPSVGKIVPLLAFISITSGKHHAHLRHAIRNGWILPCRLSPRCDYRFFVDAHPHITSLNTNSANNAGGPDLILENATYGDLVFRDDCPMMLTRHSLSVNYGNSPPLGDNLFIQDPNPPPLPAEGEKEREKTPNPDYPLRRMYKIDWKVCFLQVIDSLLGYRLDEDAVFAHVFVEDDSFVCTENLLYQLGRACERRRETADLKDMFSSSPFRTGIPMYDGFDDSSTIMHNAIARVFRHNYPNRSDFDCGRIAHTTDAQVLKQTPFLSWGNSWMTRNCDWSRLLHDLFNLTVAKPALHCSVGIASLSRPRTINGSASVHPVPHSLAITNRCLSRPLILHNGRAAEILLEEESRARLRHTCEHFLLIDKVKEPSQLQQLWRETTVTGTGWLHDMSDLFVIPSLAVETKASPPGDGWERVMQRLADEERVCEDEATKLDSLVRERESAAKSKGKGRTLSSSKPYSSHTQYPTPALTLSPTLSPSRWWWDDPAKAHYEFPCLFEFFEERVHRQLRARTLVYGDSEIEKDGDGEKGSQRRRAKEEIMVEREVLHRLRTFSKRDRKMYRELFYL